MPPVLRSASKAKEGAPNKSRIADQRIEPRPKKKLNFVRNKADFVWIALMMGVLVVLGEHYFPHRTPESQQVAIYEAFNVGGAFLPVGTSVWHRAAPYAVFFLMTGVSLSGLTLMLYFVMQYLRPRTSPQTFEFVLSKQLKTIFFNLAVLLPAYQTFWEWLVNSGYTKVTIDRLSPFHIVGDIFLWVLAFELLWYAQHRAMHDSKTLWKFGHEYHHSWRQPEHMIGVTNFAFDALVEGWVTMSSSFLPVLVFPINWYSRSVIGLLYMLLAVLVHWDFFPIRYHLNHHYYVTKNYGSHIPIFDMLFGTYKGDYFVLEAWHGRQGSTKVNKNF